MEGNYNSYSMVPIKSTINIKRLKLSEKTTFRQMAGWAKAFKAKAIPHDS